MTTDGRRAALLVIDMQNDFCDPAGLLADVGAGDLPDQATLADRINQVATACRDAGQLVVWVRIVWDGPEDAGVMGRRGPVLLERGWRRGTWGAELIPELVVEASDHHIEKKRFSAFYETDLDDLLRANGVEDLFVTGIRSDYCVESTVRDAFFRDYDVHVVSDAVHGYVPHLHEHSLEEMGSLFAHIIDTSQALEALEGKR